MSDNMYPIEIADITSGEIEAEASVNGWTHARLIDVSPDSHDQARLYAIQDGDAEVIVLHTSGNDVWRDNTTPDEWAELLAEYEINERRA